MLRIAVLVGGALYVTGGLAGWYVDTKVDPGSSDDVPIRLHYFFGIGNWVWLIIAPTLLAAIAPFSRRWLTFLWLGPGLLLGLAVILDIEGKNASLAFPHQLLLPESRHWGLTLSLIGSSLATASLVGALILVLVKPDQASALGLYRRIRQANRRLVAAVLLIVACGIAIAVVVSRDPATNRVEHRLASRINESLVRCHRPYPANKPIPTPHVRTHCDRVGTDRWHCVYDYEYPNGRGGGADFTTDGSGMGPPLSVC
jgi:hypothetical protein